MLGLANKLAVALEIFTLGQYLIPSFLLADVSCFHFYSGYASLC